MWKGAGGGCTVHFHIRLCLSRTTLCHKHLIVVPNYGYARDWNQDRWSRGIKQEDEEVTGGGELLTL